MAGSGLAIGHEEIIPLQDLGDIAQDIPGIPQMIYEPQVEGNWQRLFGYFYDDSQVRRIGKRENINCLELFAGAGGMSKGYENAGINVKVAVEKDPDSVRTLKKNSNSTNVIEDDVKNFLSWAANVTQPTKQLIGNFDLIHASSPCQGFSSANRLGGSNDKTNNDLAYTIVQGARDHNPIAGIFENVEGMWRRKNLHYLKDIVKQLMQLGYQVRCAVLKACDFGVPQKRPRLI